MPATGDSGDCNLRPLSLGELLDRTFTYYREHFWTFVGIMAPAEIVVVAVTVLFRLSGWHALEQSATPSPDPKQLLARLIPLYTISFVVFLVSWLAHSIALGAVSSAVSKIHLGGRTTIAESYRSLRGAVRRLCGLSGLYLLIITGVYSTVFVAVVLLAGAVAVIARPAGFTRTALGIVVGATLVLVGTGGLILASMLCLRYALAVPALVLERLGPGRALSRSRMLTKGGVGRVVLACLLMYLITLVVAATVQTPFSVAGLLMGFKFGHNPLWLAAPSTIAAGVGGTLGYPVLMIVLPLLYYDARVRKEAFDLQLMMSSLALTSPLATETETAGETSGLSKTSVALMVLLTIVTLGIYEPVWFLNRLRAINRLNASDRLSRWVFIAALIVCSLNVTILLFVPRTGGFLAPYVPDLVRTIGLATGILLLISGLQGSAHPGPGTLPCLPARSRSPRCAGSLSLRLYVGQSRVFVEGLADAGEFRLRRSPCTDAKARGMPSVVRVPTSTCDQSECCRHRQVRAAHC